MASNIGLDRLDCAGWSRSMFDNMRRVEAGQAMSGVVDRARGY